MVILLPPPYKCWDKRFKLPSLVGFTSKGARKTATKPLKCLTQGTVTLPREVRWSQSRGPFCTRVTRGHHSWKRSTRETLKGLVSVVPTSTGGFVHSQGCLQRLTKDSDLTDFLSLSPEEQSPHMQGTVCCHWDTGRQDGRTAGQLTRALALGLAFLSKRTLATL